MIFVLLFNVDLVFGVFSTGFCLCLLSVVVDSREGTGHTCHSNQARPECQIIQPNYKDTTTHNIRPSLVLSRPQVNMVNTNIEIITSQ